MKFKTRVTKESKSDLMKLGWKNRKERLWRQSIFTMMTAIGIVIVAGWIFFIFFMLKFQNPISLRTPVWIEPRWKVEAQVNPVEVKKEPVTIKEHICAATNGENCDVLYNLCVKESGKWVKDGEKCSQYSVGKNTNGTFDYSYYQINDVHIIGRPASQGRGTITMDCVYDLYCSSRWVNEQVKAGRGSIWVAWKNI